MMPVIVGERSDVGKKVKNCGGAFISLGLQIPSFEGTLGCF